VRAAISWIAFLAAAAFGASSALSQPSEPLGLYVVRGSAAQLERFNAKMKDWKGGEFLERLSSKTEYRYWAYPMRTAGEARIFMFGAMAHGLRFDIEEFDETVFYPKERASLDEFVATCRVKDPFRIQPNRTLLIAAEPGTSFEDVDCILGELKKAHFENVMPIYFVGNEVRDERD
jgi:hypothetical protein